MRQNSPLHNSIIRLFAATVGGGATVFGRMRRGSNKVFRAQPLHAVFRCMNYNLSITGVPTPRLALINYASIILGT